MTRPGNKNPDSKWIVIYHSAVIRNDIPPLGKTQSTRIRNAIEQKLAVDPVLFGIPLRATLKRYWKLRVGDYRIVYSITKNEVLILVIAHRKDVYGIARKR